MLSSHQRLCTEVDAEVGTVPKEVTFLGSCLTGGAFPYLRPGSGKEPERSFPVESTLGRCTSLILFVPL